MFIFRNLFLKAAALLLVLVVAAGDFALQWSKSDGAYGPQQYAAGLFQRFGESDGFMGDIFRKSALVAPALPPAPAGWRQVAWIDVPYGVAYSASQDDALEQHLDWAAGDMTSLRSLDGDDEVRFETHFNDTSMVYYGADSYVELTVKAEGYEFRHPIWTEYLDRVDAYFEKIDRRIPYADFQGLAWYELRGPVEEASNDDLPYKLQMFETNLGRVVINLTTRGPDAEIDAFLQNVDLSKLHKLNDAPAGEVPDLAPSSGAAPELAQQAEPEDGIFARLLGGGSSNASGGGTAVVVNRAGGGCAAGQFCLAGQ